MHSGRVIGFLVILAGAICLAWGAGSYFAKREAVGLDDLPVRAVRKEVPPQVFIGAGLVLIGISVVAAAGDRDQRLRTA